jgi:hypothetical protein
MNWHIYCEIRDILKERIKNNDKINYFSALSCLDNALTHAYYDDSIHDDKLIPSTVR